MPPNAAHAEDDYFNDLSRQPNLPTAGNGNVLRAPDGPLNREEASLPRQKRVACVICRKRKLKCDGNRPSCGTCARLGHNCAYDEVRRKSGPKRGYVKELEARLGMIFRAVRGSPLTGPQLQPKSRRSLRRMFLVLQHRQQAIHPRYQLPQHRTQPRTLHTMSVP